jgi:hypothetical protein
MATWMPRWKRIWVRWVTLRSGSDQGLQVVRLSLHQSVLLQLGLLEHWEEERRAHRWAAAGTRTKQAN